MTPHLRSVLEAQRVATDTLQRERGVIIPFVFHHGGRAIKSFYKTWKSACRAVGCPGRIVHDFRRAAVRNLERAGVPRSTAMRMVGHRTMEIYSRYAIVDEVMLQEGSAKLAAYLEGTLGKVADKVAAFGGQRTRQEGE
jgi:integrase